MEDYDLDQLWRFHTDFNKAVQNESAFTTLVYRLIEQLPGRFTGALQRQFNILLRRWRQSKTRVNSDKLFNWIGRFQHHTPLYGHFYDYIMDPDYERTTAFENIPRTNYETEIENNSGESNDEGSDQDYNQPDGDIESGGEESGADGGMRITKKCEAQYGGQMTRDLYNYHRQVGGKMSVSQFQKFLTNSYSKKPEQKIDNFEYDPELSIDRAKVYYDPKTGQAVITHTGTDNATDWLNNLAIATNTYKYTSRYKNAKKAQEATEKKYGKQNVSTTGHSQGSRLAEKLGKESKEILTLNKATNPFEQYSSKNQTDVRSSGDWVSSLNPLGWMEKNKKVKIPKQSNNIIKEHSPDVLSRLDPNMMIGEGRTYKQKFNKKHGFSKDKSHSLSDIAKITGYDKKHLQIIIDKGKGAYYSNPQSVRPNVTSPEQWSYARLYASLDPTSKAHKIDKSHLIKNKKLRNLCDCGDANCKFC